MAITEALVKRVNSFDLQKISETEEEYIVWQVADTFFNSTVGDVGTLSTSSSGNTSIGSHTDTSYDQAVGSHPGSGLTQTTTSTALYQNFGADATVNNVYPIINTNNTLNFKSTNSSELDTILDRLIEKVFGDQYFNYRLGSTAPAGYTLYISSVFSDIRTDGASVTYNLYKKNLPTKPTTIRPMKSVGADFRTMSDTEIKECFAQRIRNKISDTSIGSYELRSSSDGVPSGGTWVALGTAIDSRQDTADENYTRVSNRDSTRISNRDSTQNFTRLSQTAYAGDYIGTFTRSRDSAVYAAAYAGVYAGQYTRTSTRTSEVGYTVGFAGNYIGTDYTGNYATNFTRSRVTAYARTSIRDSTRVSTRGYMGFYYNGVPGDVSTFILYYTGNFVGNYTGNYTGNFLGDYIANFTRVSNTAYTRTSTILYTGTYDGNFIGNYDGAYAGTYDGIDYTATFIGNYDGNFIGNYTADYTGDYTGNFIGDYTGNYIGNYTGNYAGETIQSSSSQVEIYTLYHRIA